LVPGPYGRGPARVSATARSSAIQRRADMKAILNAKIKRPESFRPFALSVLAEAVR
jgi:predicted NodU family carbamoyl transferase